MFFKCFQITKTTIFVKKGILIPLRARLLSHHTRFRNILHINLNSLAGVLHLFIRLWYILWIRKLYCKLVSSSQKTIQARDGSSVTTLTQLYPEYDKACVLIASEHVQDQLDLFRCMLVWMTVRTMRTICQRLQCAVIALEPAMDVLTVGFVPNSSLCDAIFLSIMN